MNLNSGIWEQPVNMHALNCIIKCITVPRKRGELLKCTEIVDKSKDIILQNFSNYPSKNKKKENRKLLSN